MATQSNELFTSNWWTSTGITITGGAIDGLRSFAETTIGNVPQARLAKTALKINSIVLQGSAGAASGGATGNVYNGLTSAAIGAIVTIGVGTLAVTSSPIVVAAVAGTVASLAFD